METHIDAKVIGWSITSTKSEVSRYVASYLLAILVLAYCFAKSCIKLTLNATHYSLHLRIAKDFIINYYFWYTLSDKRSAQVTCEVTNRWSLVYRLVLKAHTCLQLVLSREVPTASLVVNTNDWCKTESCLVTAKKNVGSIGL